YEEQLPLYEEYPDLYDKLKDRINDIIIKIQQYTNTIKDNIKAQFRAFEDSIKPLQDELGKYTLAVDYFEEKLKHAPNEQRAKIFDTINFYIEKQIEVLQKLKEEYEKQLPLYEQYPDLYRELQNAINDIIIKTQRYRNAILDNVDAKEKDIEATKKQIEEEKNKAKELIDAYRSFITEGIEEEIETLEKAKKAAQEAANAKIEAIQKQIDLLEKQNDALKEQEEREKRLIDLAKQREKVANIEREKNVQIYREGKGWVWESDPKALKQETERLKEMEEEYYQWERDLKYKKQIEDLRNQIEYIKETLKNEESAYDRRIDQLREFINNYNKEWKRQQYQITSYEQLLNELSKFEVKIYADRLDALNKFINDYNNLMSKLEPLPNTSSLSTNNITTSPSTNSNTITNTDYTKSSYVQIWHPIKQQFKTVVGDLVKQYESQGWTTQLPTDEELQKIIKSLKGYDTGGVVEYTGLAKVHGRPNAPEIVLNTEQAKNLFNFIKGLPQTAKNLFSNVRNLQANIPNLSKNNEIIKKTENHYHFENLNIQANDPNEMFRKLNMI
ncbi:MAG TPA: hypothetical protein PKK61_14000, partial [Defluviitaleaceae bacterium]|nr:hypothetical protein [Defluviitaleaceae bacterium]